MVGGITQQEMYVWVFFFHKIGAEVGKIWDFLCTLCFLFTCQFVEISHKCGQIYVIFICIFVRSLPGGKGVLKETRLGRILQLVGTQKYDLSNRSSTMSYCCIMSVRKRGCSTRCVIWRRMIPTMQFLIIV